MGGDAKDQAVVAPAGGEQGENGEYRVYFQRHLVLASYSLIMFGWNLSGTRQVSVVPSYAKHHDTTNEINFAEGWGIDSWTILTSGILLFSYFFGSYAVDRWGLHVMNIGAWAIAVGCGWIWYAADDSMVGVILGRSLGDLFGPMVSSALLAISNRWYAPDERAKATAIGSLINVLGSGAALVVSPMFATQADEVVDLTLRSCALPTDGFTGDNAWMAPIVARYNAATLAGEQLLCTGDDLKIREVFCCYLPVDIGSLNLVMAIVPTLIAIFSTIVVRDLPPTPPAPSGANKDFVGLVRGLKMMFSNQRFAKLALSDFIISGPPLVLFAAISRIFPSSVSEYTFVASASGLVLALPVAMVVAHYLDKTKMYWTFTMVGYATGTAFWLIATGAFAINTVPTDWLFFVMVVLAIGAYVAWQTAVYETKLEYVFSHDTALEGWIVGADRIVINLSSIVFISAVPPERFDGLFPSRPAMGLLIVGGIVMLLGCVPTAIIKDKYRYMRKAWDDECGDCNIQPL